MEPVESIVRVPGEEIFVPTWKHPNHDVPIVLIHDSLGAGRQATGYRLPCFDHRPLDADLSRPIKQTRSVIETERQGLVVVVRAAFRTTLHKVISQ